MAWEKFCYAFLFLSVVTSCISPLPQLNKTKDEPITQDVSTPQTQSTFEATFHVSPTIELPTNTSTHTPTMAPPIQIKVMTYNILWGGGADPEFDEEAGRTDRNRFNRLVSILERANPDILGIQEAAGWNQGTPSVIQQIARTLKMNYYITDSWNELPVAILTKYKIIETENLTDLIGNNGALRARLLTPEGAPINVFVVHLHPFSWGRGYRECQIRILTHLIEPYSTELSFLLGDFNASPGAYESKSLLNAGWMHIIGGFLDHIWISPLIDWVIISDEYGFSYDDPILYNVSDHLPVFAEIGILNDLIKNNLSTPVPSMTISFPSIVYDYLINSLTKNINRFDQHYPCWKNIWHSTWQSERVVDQRLEIIGKYPWAAGVSSLYKFTGGEGFILNFNYERNSEFEIYLNHGEWKTKPYRRFGVYIRYNDVQSNIFQGGNSLGGGFLRGNLRLVPDKWYQIMIAVNKNGEFLTVIWDPEDMTQRISYFREMGEDWKELPWRFAIGVNKGKVLFDDFLRFSFDGFK